VTIIAAPEDFRLLNLFYEQCVPVIPGHFHSEIWSTLIPQLGNTSLAVHHAMLAVASVYDETSQAGRPLDETAEPIEGTAVSTSQALTLKHYTASLHELRQHMNQAMPSQTVILTTCVLFVCLEAMRGRSDAAMRHIESGLNILKHRTNNDRAASSSDSHVASDNDIPDYLSAGFGRMSLLLNSVKEHEQHHSANVVVVDPRVFADTPATYIFTSVEEARAALVPLLSKAGQLVYSPLSNHTAGILGPNPAVTVRMELDAQLRQWAGAFDVFLKNTSRVRSAGHDILRAFAKISSIRLWASLHPDDTPLVFLTEDFAELLGFAESCMGLQGWVKKSSPTNIKHTDIKPQPSVFIMDLGIIGPLLFVACRCADRDLRFKAIEMLERAPRREALWSSESAARTARQVNMSLGS